MKNLPQKPQQNKTQGGISLKDALSAIWRNSHIMVLPTTIALLICSACFALLLFPRNEIEACDTNNRIYQTLLSRNQEWMAYFSTVPESSNNAINLENGLYVVRSFGRSPDGQPILLIATQHSSPRTLYGEAGYIYTSGDTLTVLDDRYTVQQLSPHIYCYERINS